MATIQLNIYDITGHPGEVTPDALRQRGNNYQIQIWLESDGIQQMIRLGAGSNAPRAITMFEAIAGLSHHVLARVEDELGRDFDEIDDELILELTDATGRTTQVSSDRDYIETMLMRLIEQVSIHSLEPKH